MYFEDEDKKQKVMSASIDMTDICYYQLVEMIESVGFSAIHFLYYKKKNLRGRGHLVHIDNDSHVRKMISEHKNEKRVHFYVFKERPPLISHHQSVSLMMKIDPPESIERTMSQVIFSPKFHPHNSISIEYLTRYFSGHLFMPALSN